jgi:hypothetical protein
MIVAAVDGYAAKYGLAIDQVFKRFWEYDVFNVLRSCHDTLHTQSLGESAAFADDYITRMTP